jgi:hypothetical protein
MSLQRLVPPESTPRETACGLQLPMFPKMMILQVSISRQMAADRRRRASEFGRDI